MPVTEGAQALQVALGRRQDAGGARDGLDDDRGDGLGAVQGHQPLHLVGLLRPVVRQAPGEGVPLEVEGVGDVVRPREGEIGPPVVDQAAHGNPAEADAVIALLPPDEAHPLPLAPGAVIGQGHLQGRVDGL